MLIISNFKDYYDAALYTGIDKKLVYRRNKKVGIENNIFSRHRYAGLEDVELKKGWVHFELFTIFFCGKGYNGIKVITSKNFFNGVYNEKVQSYDFFYSYTSLVKKYPHIKKKVEGSSKWYRRPNMWFKEHKTRKSNVPIVIKEEHKTIENGRLEDYKFWRIMPYMQAFQELSMFIGAINNLEEIVDIDDVHKAAGKGFDCYSFKKEPTKHKRKKCRRL